MYQKILLGVASLWRNNVDRGKARVCHFGLDLRCSAQNLDVVSREIVGVLSLEILWLIGEI